MSYEVPYEADYECPKGHQFVAKANPVTNQSSVLCPHCYAEWVASNVPMAKQITKSRVAEIKSVTL